MDMAAHRRLDNVERRLDDHYTLIENLEVTMQDNTSSLAENTRLTQEIATNTGELVELFKGAKAVRRFFLWATPIVAGIYALWQWLSGR